MSRSGTGVKVATGVWAFPTRYRVIAAVGARQRETSFPLGTDLDDMLAWQLDTKAELLRDHPTASTGTLAADVPRFLSTVSQAKTREYHRVNLQPWIARFGQVARADITSVMIRQALALWAEAPRAPGEPPYAPNTLNHRLSSLRKLYAVLDADDERAYNPCTRVQKLPTPRPEPREIPAVALDAIFAALPVHRYKGQGAEATAAIYAAATAPGANRSAIARQYGISETAVRKIVQRNGATEKATMAASRIRLEVKRRTGLPWKQVGAIKAEHLRLADDAQAAIAGRLWVTPRRKGKGTQGRWLPLTREAAEACTALVEHCPGPFSSSSIYQFFQRAVTAAIKAAAAAGTTLPAMPPDVRPYDIRHTFLTQVLRASGNRKAVQDLGLHAQASTSDRYTLGASTDNTEAALAAYVSWARRGQDTPS